MKATALTPDSPFEKGSSIAAGLFALYCICMYYAIGISSTTSASYQSRWEALEISGIFAGIITLWALLKIAGPLRQGISLLINGVLTLISLSIGLCLFIAMAAVCVVVFVFFLFLIHGLIQVIFLASPTPCVPGDCDLPVFLFFQFSKYTFGYWFIEAISCVIALILTIGTVNGMNKIIKEDEGFI